MPLLSTGYNEISDRKWGVPRDKQIDIANPAYALGWPIPILHIHADKEPEIVRALLEMGVMPRKFGHHTMLSGVIDLRNVPNPEAMFGQKLPEATQVNEIDPKRNAYKPHFHFRCYANVAN